MPTSSLIPKNPKLLWSNPRVVVVGAAGAVDGAPLRDETRTSLTTVTRAMSVIERGRRIRRRALREESLRKTSLNTSRRKLRRRFGV